MELSLVNNENRIITRSTFTTLRFPLKHIIFEYLPIEESFNTIFSCSKSFISAFKKTKIFGLIQSGDLQKIKTISISFECQINRFFDNLS